MTTGVIEQRDRPDRGWSDPTVAFDHVWFAYAGDDYVLRDVSFDVKRGERVDVGATGAGKTTIISC